jgi:hypothetical protein
LDESSGYQVGSQAEIETTVADAVMNYLRSQKEVVKVVPGRRIAGSLRAAPAEGLDHRP